MMDALKGHRFLLNRENNVGEAYINVVRYPFLYHCRKEVTREIGVMSIYG